MKNCIVKSFSCIAPKKFDQYLILNQVVDIPDTTILAQSILDKPVYKRDQPEGLKMRYKPYGYYSGNMNGSLCLLRRDLYIYMYRQ